MTGFVIGTIIYDLLARAFHWFEDDPEWHRTRIVMALTTGLIFHWTGVIN